MSINVAELAVLGAKIAEIGVKLGELREQRNALDTQISTLEKELTPLIVQHSKIVASITTQAMPTPAPGTSPTGLVPVQEGAGVVSVSADSAMKARVKEYLKRGHMPEGVSAVDIAETLKVDAFVVREAMRELREASPSLPIDPDR